VWRDIAESMKPSSQQRVDRLIVVGEGRGRSDRALTS